MLRRLELENFRSYKKFAIELENTTIFIGLNGAGKTNILESVSLISHGRSFRDDDKRALINFDSTFARAKGDELEIYIESVPRLKSVVKERGVGRKIIDFIGKLPAVVFSPETIGIITGSPKERRKFLDIMISQIDKEYLRALSNYTKARRQRNRLLQSIKEGKSSESELSFWDNELTLHGKIISKRRAMALLKFNKEMSKYYREISDDPKSELLIEYIDRSGDDLGLKLKENRRREIAYGGTIYGPHRDDLVFYLNKKDMSNFASRGELRSAILALKIAEVNFLENELNTSSMSDEKKEPILLLDDIFSEFDSKRKEHLGNLILNFQSIITTTDKIDLSKDIIANSRIVELKVC